MISGLTIGQDNLYTNKLFKIRLKDKNNIKRIISNFRTLKNYYLVSSDINGYFLYYASTRIRYAKCIVINPVFYSANGQLVQPPNSIYDIGIINKSYVILTYDFEQKDDVLKIIKNNNNNYYIVSRKDIEKTIEYIIMD